MPRKKTKNVYLKSATGHAEAGAATLVTLAFRLPILFAAPSAAMTAEWTRAGTEKMTAGMRGAMAAGLALHSFALRSAGGHVQAEKYAEEWLAVSDAALTPAYRTVAANARRLSRRRAG